MPFISNNQPSEVVQPCEQTFDFPASFVSAQHSSILGPGLLPVAPMRSNQFGLECFEKPLIQRIAGIRAISDQPLWLLVNETRFERLLYERDFMRRSAACPFGERKTSAVCHCHDLAAFAALGLANAKAPFFAGVNVPSIKHSDTSSPPRSRKSSARAQSTVRSVPDRTKA